MLKVSASVRAQSISVQFKGRAKTFWLESPEDLEPQDFSGHEQYFSSFQFVFGVQNGPEQIIKPGIYAFDCIYKLPAHLPSTMNNSLGKVVYSVIVQIQSNSNGFQQKEITRNFKVLSQLDLNEYPNLKYKIENLSTEFYGCKCLCCLCCKSRVIDMVTVIPCGGYVPGEDIPIFIEIDNRSKHDIESVVCEMFEITTFTTTVPYLSSKRLTRQLWEHTFNGVKSHENRFFQTNLFLDPKYNFKVLYGCGIIDIKYFLKTTGNILTAKSLTNEIELMIGTNPFTDNEDLKLKKRKSEVISTLKRVIPGSLLIAGRADIKNATENDPLLPKNKTKQ